MSVYESQLEESLKTVEGGAEVLAARNRRLPRNTERPAPNEAARGMYEEGRLLRLAQEGKIRRGTGKLPEDFWDLPRPEDPDATVRRAVEENRR